MKTKKTLISVFAIIALTAILIVFPIFEKNFSSKSKFPIDNRSIRCYFICKGNVTERLQLNGILPIVVRRMPFLLFTKVFSCFDLLSRTHL